MEQRYTFYVPILGGPSRSIIRDVARNKVAKLWFKCKGLPFNRWIKLEVTSLRSAPGNCCQIICEGEFRFPRVLITDTNDHITLRPFEKYEFDIKYRFDFRTGRISSIGRPATKNPP